MESPLYLMFEPEQNISLEILYKLEIQEINHGIAMIDVEMFEMDYEVALFDTKDEAIKDTNRMILDRFKNMMKRTLTDALVQRLNQIYDMLIQHLDEEDLQKLKILHVQLNNK